MQLSDLVQELHSMGVVRPTTADPRIPPVLELENPSPSEEYDEPGLTVIPVEEVLKPIKVPKDGDLILEPDWPGDWLEECDGYPIIHNEEQLPEGRWEPDGEEMYPDCWAWYCPFHFYEEEAGIYVRGDKLSIISRNILRIMTLYERGMLMYSHKNYRKLFGHQIKQAAFLHFFLHEMYHHKVEAFATRLEIATGVPKFVPYYDSVYRPLSHPLSDELIEEGLANAEVLRRVTGDRTYRAKQFPTLPGCPNVRAIWERFEFYNNQICRVPGYQTVKNYIKPGSKFSESDFVVSQRRLQHMVSQASSKPLGDPRRWSFAPGMMAPFWNKDIIAYEVVYPGRISSLVPGGVIQAVQASPRKVLRIARKWGITKAREARGDHSIYSGRSGKKVSIDEGYNDLPNSCWEGLIDIINVENGLSLRNNQEGRRRFFNGP